MKRLLPPLLLICLGAALTAPADNTTRRGLRVDPSALAAPTDTVAVTEDTVSVSDGDIVVSGYDKPLHSYGESFFVTNKTDSAITGLELTIDYRDIRGRQLHHRSLRHDIDLPAGETRRADISSWDRRQTFYYIRGPKPRTSGVTPFDVKITVVRAFRRR